MQASCNRNLIHIWLVQAGGVSDVLMLFAPQLQQSIHMRLACRLDEDDYGGVGPLLTEGMAPSISVFMVRFWVVALGCCPTYLYVLESAEVLFVRWAC